MQDQVASLKAKGIKACFFGSEQPDKTLQMAHHNICYITPEYLKYKGHNGIKNNLHRILFFAIDEAHIVEQWRDFRPAYKELGSLRKRFPEIPIIALTATAPQYVQDYVTEKLKLRVNFLLVKTALDRPNLSFEVKNSSSDYISQVLPLLKQITTGSAIVYCIPQAGTEIMSEKFREHGLDCRPYHAKLPKETKAKTVEDFRTGKLRFVVCTIAFGMGIDKPDVRLVVHYGMCKSIEAYYQEAGRAGRDGKPSKCIVFLDHSDKAILYKFIRDSKDVTETEKQQQYRLVDTFVSFLTSDKCRRIQMLDYLGTTDEERAKLTIRDTCCDNCQRDLKIKVPAKLMYWDVKDDGTFDFTNEARILLKAVHIELLRNAVIDNIVGELPSDTNFRHFKLASNGSGTARPRDYWESLLSMLILNNYCSIAGNCVKLQRIAKHLIKYKGKKVLVPPSQDIKKHLNLREDVEFFWDNNSIKSRPTKPVPAVNESQGLRKVLSEEEKRFQEQVEIDSLQYIDWDNEDNGCDEAPTLVSKTILPKQDPNGLQYLDDADEDGCDEIPKKIPKLESFV